MRRTPSSAGEVHPELLHVPAYLLVVGVRRLAQPAERFAAFSLGSALQERCADVVRSQRHAAFGRPAPELDGTRVVAAILHEHAERYGGVQIAVAGRLLEPWTSRVRVTEVFVEQPAEVARGRGVASARSLLVARARIVEAIRGLEQQAELADEARIAALGGDPQPALGLLVLLALAQEAAELVGKRPSTTVGSEHRLAAPGTTRSLVDTTSIDGGIVRSRASTIRHSNPHTCFRTLPQALVG